MLAFLVSGPELYPGQPPLRCEMVVINAGLISMQDGVQWESEIG